MMPLRLKPRVRQTKDMPLLSQWFEIQSQADCAKLLELLGGFHDGCLREVHVWAGIFVDTDLAMSNCVPDPMAMKARVLIQRQWPSPSAVELLFQGVSRLNVAAPAAGCDAIIFGATLTQIDGTFYWAEIGDWHLGRSDRDDVTWVGGKQLHWRDVSDWMGPALRYASPDDLLPA